MQDEGKEMAEKRRKARQASHQENTDCPRKPPANRSQKQGKRKSQARH